MIINEQLIGNTISFIYQDKQMSGIVSAVDEQASTICISGIWYYSGNIRLIMDNVADRMQKGQSLILG